MEESTVTTPGSVLHNHTDHYCSDDNCLCLLSWNYTVLDNSILFLYLLFLVVGLVENALVLWINWKMKKAKKESNFYVFNLAIADMSAVLTIPFRMTEILYNYEWTWSNFLCKFDAFLYNSNLYSSIFFLTYMSVDRYFSLRYPSQAQGSRDRRIRRLVCVCLWTLAMVLSIPTYLIYDVFISVQQFCFIDTLVSWYIQSTMVIIFGFFIPFPIMIVSNIFTAKAAKASNNKESIRICKLIYAYIIVFLLCWSPFYILSFLSLLDWSRNCIMLQIIYVFHDLGKCLTFSHCITNPILYNFMQKDFRYHLATSVVKFLPKKYVKEDDNVSISSDTKHIVVIS